jgi:hypothetical protein
LKDRDSSISPIDLDVTEEYFIDEGMEDVKIPLNLSFESR